MSRNTRPPSSVNNITGRKYNVAKCVPKDTGLVGVVDRLALHIHIQQIPKSTSGNDYCNSGWSVFLSLQASTGTAH